jgi:cbb3-type cytochrome oxidase maturation protein
MIYGFAWAFLLVASLGASLLGFFWALRTGQFTDQDRARFLPLRDEFPRPGLKNPARLSPEVYALACMMGFGGVLLAAAIWLLLA